MAGQLPPALPGQAEPNAEASVEELLLRVGQAHTQVIQAYEEKLGQLRSKLGRLHAHAGSGDGVKDAGPAKAIEPDGVQLAIEPDGVQLAFDSETEELAAPLPLSRLNTALPEDFKLLGGWRRELTRYSMEGFIDLSRRQCSNHDRSQVQRSAETQQSSNRCVILPESTFRLLWDICGLVLIAYDLVTIPFNQAFMLEPSLTGRVLDMITILFWTLDMCQGFFLGFYHKGQVVTDARKIVFKYAKTWLPVDLVVVVPEWAMMLLLDGRVDGQRGTREPTGDIGKFAKFARVARVLRLARLIKLKKLLNVLADRIENEYTFIVFSLLQLMGFVLVLNHVIACVWYVIGRLSRDQGITNWVDVGQVSEEDVSYLYATALHWSLTQFTPASMDISARNLWERSFSICVLLFAMLIFSTLVASITTSMTTLRNLRGDSLRQFWLLRRYLRQRNISKSLSNRILKFLEHQIEVQGRLVQSDKLPLLKGLSDALQNELMHQMHSGVLVSQPFFGYLSTNTELCPVMHRLCRVVLQQVSFGEKESVFALGDEAKKMWFVRNGDIEYTTAADSVTMLPKEWLSEAVLFTAWRHLGDLVALCESELVSVNPEQFMAVMSVHPRPWCFTQSYARKFIQLLNSMEVSALTDIINDTAFYSQAVVESDEFSMMEATKTLAGSPSSQARLTVFAAPSNAFLSGHDSDPEEWQATTSASSVQLPVLGGWPCWPQLGQTCSRWRSFASSQ